MREGWDTALDHQTDLIRAAITAQGRRYLDGFAASLSQSGLMDPETGEAYTDANPSSAFEMVNGMTMMLPNCDPMYVSDDLTDLINFAAETFRPEPFQETDLIAPTGFAYFAKPLLIHDTHGTLMPNRAVQWSITESRQSGTRGLLIALYSHRDDEDDYSRQRGAKLPKIGGADLAMSHVTGFDFGDDRVKRWQSNVSVTELVKHLNVFFRLTQQTIAVSRHERVSRPVWKRAATWRQIKHVVVFTLRRANTTAKYEGDREVEWTHRWMVGAHWHTYHYKDGTSKQLWLAPYVKGPDDKPLILKKRAFELIR